MNIIKIYLKETEMWVSYDIKNIKSIKDGKKTEKVECVATFIKDGEEIHRIYNVGDFNFCAKLLDREFAIKEAEKMIEHSNKSKHSPF